MNMMVMFVFHLAARMLSLLILPHMQARMVSWVLQSIFVVEQQNSKGMQCVFRSLCNQIPPIQLFFSFSHHAYVTMDTIKKILVEFLSTLNVQVLFKMNARLKR